MLEKGMLLDPCRMRLLTACFKPNLVISLLVSFGRSVLNPDRISFGNGRELEGAKLKASNRLGSRSALRLLSCSPAADCEGRGSIGEHTDMNSMTGEVSMPVMRRKP